MTAATRAAAVAAGAAALLCVPATGNATITAGTLTATVSGDTVTSTITGLSSDTGSNIQCVHLLVAADATARLLPSFAAFPDTTTEVEFTSVPEGRHTVFARCLDDTSTAAFGPAEIAVGAKAAVTLEAAASGSTVTVTLVGADALGENLLCHVYLTDGTPPSPEAQGTSAVFTDLGAGTHTALADCVDTDTGDRYGFTAAPVTVGSAGGGNGSIATS